ncbi:COMM domain-containing protein 6-like [Physella acuta]|uniref:COMM domain-containing protein 6-like n=1 Tax=Physella acuta TaxID=109671 RepID=UPI0027DB48EE|nr:COMM domain-containing protein 6-like [Physella acuta]
MPGTEYVAQVTDVDIKWKVSMAVSSNDVRSLNEPMVTMMLVTTEESGNTVNRPVEMTLTKFKELLSTMKQIQNQMELAKLV